MLFSFVTSMFYYAVSIAKSPIDYSQREINIVIYIYFNYYKVKLLTMYKVLFTQTHYLINTSTISISSYLIKFRRKFYLNILYCIVNIVIEYIIYNSTVFYYCTYTFNIYTLKIRKKSKKIGSAVPEIGTDKQKDCQKFL